MGERERERERKREKEREKKRESEREDKDRITGGALIYPEMSIDVEIHGFLDEAIGTLE